ncbi:hypothetical protein LZ480_16165 [Solibacillus sp. MA9]|uniref:Uncharacterized protein n=1 Tax=Solibacillus palustris TaxID=2908203 RepID=A0ABS9UGC3_9BACL|nr:hypothetical protein [Solibacillus sp. MA9]MCH7323411.1 hypothetical protein [Solibacillus sp. MA9]
MKNKLGSSVIGKISWMIAFLLVVYGSIIINNQAKAFSSATYNLTPYLCASAITSIIIGSYIALLFLKQLKLQFNTSLFVCVTIPCLVLTLYYPVLVIAQTFLENFQFLVPHQLVRLTSENIFGVVAGLTLVLSVFKWKD